MKRQNGITLIALVITIIVLLILAGVSISAINGQNGLLSKAKTAKNETGIAQEKEEISATYVALKGKNELNANYEPITATQLEVAMNNAYGEGTVEVTGTEDLKVTYTDSGRSYWVDQDAIVETVLTLEQSFAVAEKPVEQTVSTAVGLDENGRPVNMDLWTYEMNEEGNEFYLGLYNYGYGTSGYKNENIVGGKIQGKIPAYIKADDGEYYPVTNLQFTFMGCENLTKAPEIPNTVVTMYHTFRGCSALTTTPNIPNNVKYLNGTFRHCTALTNITALPNSILEMESTFYGCNALTETPTIPNSVTNMNYTFDRCNNLTIVNEIPDSVLSMEGTFRNCISLVNAPELSENVTSIVRIFYGCDSLEVAPKIPSKVENMSEAFYSCDSLTTATTIPESVKYMGNAFWGCVNLTGTLEINANPTNFGNCLYIAARTDRGCSLVLTGSSTMLEDILATIMTVSNITIGQ